MNPDFGYKHLTGLAWLLCLIAIVMTVLLVIRKKKGFGEKFDRAVIRYTCYFMWAWEIIKSVRMINHTDYGPVGYYPLWMAPFHICLWDFTHTSLLAQNAPVSLTAGLSPLLTQF